MKLSKFTLTPPIGAISGILLFAACALASSVASGKTIYVATTGDDSSTTPTNPLTPYKTVAKALANAGAGDTVSIAAGTYQGSFTVDKKVEIAGAGRDQTIISKSQVTITHPEAEVRDLRITGYGSGGALTLGLETGGMAGTVRRCDISGNTRTSTDGTGIRMYSGSLIDCVITNNVNSSGGNGVGVYIAAADDCSLENCLVSDNTTGYGGNCGGLYITSKINGKRVTLRHCSIVGNLGGATGGLYINSTAVNVAMIDCFVAGNCKLTDAAANNTEDAFLGWAKGYTRGITNCVIAKCPNHNAGYEITNSLFNVSAGMNQPYERDFTIGRNSPAWGAATDGTDIGCYQTDHGDAFAVGCYAEADRGIGSVTTVLHGTSVNAGGEVSYEWDLDGDGTYEASGATAEATFTALGWHSVKVRATCGEASAAATVERIACVFAPTTYVWSKSPNPTFPYGTWETASHTPHDGLAATIDGGRLQFTNEAFAIAKPLLVYRTIEMCGTGKENNSVLGNVSGFTVPKFTDVNAKGTSIQRTGGDVVNLKLYNTGAIVHSIAFGPGRPSVVGIYGESVLSNCVVRYGDYTSGSGIGITANAGLVTHCVISNNYNYNSSSGGEVYLDGKAKLRNSLVTGGRHTYATAPGCKGSVYAKGSAEVMNCTIVGNQAGDGAGLYTDGASVKAYNNIIRDNVTTCDSSDHPDWYDSVGTGDYRNNCMAVAHHEGDGTVTALPGFVLDETTGANTWTFGAASPCVDKGTPVGWATDGTTDLFGNPRVQGERIDIGCFEADVSQATCDIEVSAEEIVGGGADVTFTAKVVGATLPEDAVCLWDFDGDGTYEREGRSVKRYCGEGYHTAALKVMEGDKTLYEVVGKSDLVTVYPTVIYFDAANAEGAAFPYNTRATAAVKMSDVLAAAKSGVDIRVCAGSHDCDVQIVLNIKCTLHPAEDVTDQPRLVRKFEGNSFVSIGHSEALVEDLCLDCNGHSTVNVNVNDGTIRGCVIGNASYTSGSGIGLTMNGGLAERCQIVNNRCQGCDADGAIVWMTGESVLRNSLIRGNCLWLTQTTGRTGGFVMTKEQAVIENCTITCNTNLHYSIVTTKGGGTIRNCIIADNFCAEENKLGSPYFPSYAPVKSGSMPNSAVLDDGEKKADFDYNCYTTVTMTAVGEHDVLTGNPRFRAPAWGDYTVRTFSPAYRAGLVLDWMEEDGAVDLRGRPRLWRGKVDMGAFQCQRDPGLILLMR